MLNFTTFLYKKAGKRIRKYRKSLNLNQDAFSDKISMDHNIYMERSILSPIENGKVLVDIRPYVLTMEYLIVFSEEMNKNPKDFLFGDYKEREESVKLFLLAIIMNSDKILKNEVEEYNFPFIDIVFENRNSREIIFTFNHYLGRNVEEKKRILKPTKGLKEEIAEEKGVKIILEWFQNEYPFFTSNENVKNYKNIVGKFNSDISHNSNLLIKLLIGNAEFSEAFSRKLKSAFLYNQKSNYPDLNLSSFNKNEGHYGGIVIGNKEDFNFFVHAFNEIWERNKYEFMDYFESELFNRENLTTLTTLKVINNDLFHNIITSNKLSKVLYTLIEKEKYSLDGMEGHNNFHGFMLNQTLERKLGM